jgi:hypothetical protein
MAQMLGGEEHVDRFARGEADFSDPNSRDLQGWNQLVGEAPPEELEASVAHAARQVPPQDYDDHITPGVGGTDPLGALGGGTLGAVAAALLGNLQSGSRAGQDLRQVVPGLRSADPRQMSPAEVAKLASYTRQHDPEAFGRAAALVGRKEPGLLQRLLGNKALLFAAAALATRYMNQRMGARGRAR